MMIEQNASCRFQVSFNSEKCLIVHFRSMINVSIKSVVEKFFNLSIVYCISILGQRELFILTWHICSYLAQHGISNFTTPPHTPKHNALAERRHRHIVQTSHSLLYHAKLPSMLWSQAFLTAAYLINRLPAQHL